MNVPLLAIGIALLAVVTPSLYFWNRYQVRRMADAFLERADSLEEEGDWRGAASEISQYLQLRPDNAKARVRLAETYGRNARDPLSIRPAIQFYNEALGSNLDDKDEDKGFGAGAAAKRLSLRRRLSELHLQFGQLLLSAEQVRPSAEQFALAEEEAGKVLDADPNDSDAQRCLALARYGRYKAGDLTRRADQQDVGARLEQAWNQKAGDIELSRVLADVYRGPRELLVPGKSGLEAQDLKKLAESKRENDLKELADRVIERMVKANPKSAEAHLVQYDYCVKYQLPDAAQALKEAVKLAPENADVVLRAAEQARREAEQVQATGGSPARAKAKLEEARDQYRRLILLAPRSERGYLGLGHVQTVLGNLDDAIKTWQTGLEKSGGESVQLNASLADTYLQTGDPGKAEEAIKALEHAIDRFTSERPSPSRTRQLRYYCDVLRARLLLQKNRAPEAVDLLQRATAARETGATAGNASENWLWQAQALVQKQAGLPRQARNWEEPRKALQQAAAQAAALAKTNPLPNPWRLNLLAAELDVLSGEHQGKARAEVVRDAAKQLQDAERFPDSEPLLERLVLFYEGLGLSADADRVLERIERMEKGSKESAARYLVRARLLASRKDFEKAAQVLDAGLKAVPKEAKPLKASLAQLYLVQGKLKEARKELHELFDQDPANLVLARQLAELALESGDLSDAQHWEDVLRAAEGDEGSHWRYFKAQRLLQQAKDAKDGLFKEADDLQQELARRTPSWPPAYMLRAEIEERRGNLPEAIVACKEAIRLGDQRADVYARLIAALLQLQRYAEAEEYTKQMGDVASFPPSLASLEVWTAEHLGQLDRALEAAQRAVRIRPTDPTARIKLAQLLLASKRPKDAEEVLRTGVKEAATDPQAYTALFAFYLQNKELERARQTLADLEKLDRQEGLAGAQRARLAMTLAQGYTALGNGEKAQAKFDEARRLAPTSDVAERFADGLWPGNFAEAEKCLRRALELDPQSATARRKLAGILETRGGKENLAQARQILSPLLADSKQPAPGDYLLLARVYEAEGRIDEANQQYLTLAKRDDCSPAHLAAYVGFLLRRDRAQEATRWIDALEKSAPNDLGVAGLRARWLLAQGRQSEIEPLVEALAKKLDPGAEKDGKVKAAFALNVGNLYSSTRQHAAAERWYRRLKTESPGAWQPLAVCLARQGKMEEAVDLCVDASKSDPSPRTAIALTVVLLSGRPDGKILERAEPVLSEALQSHKGDASLLISVANVRMFQKRVEEACAKYRQVLEVQPKNGTAMNNLAALLGEQPNKQDEALGYVNRAIDAIGPQPQLLDTKAMIRFYAGDLEEAARLLEEAVLSPDPDPRYLFHLAAVYHRKGDAAKFRSTFAKVRLDDLTAALLTDADQKLLAELRGKSGS